MVVTKKAYQLLNIWMKQEGISQLELAKKLNCTKAAVCRWCQGSVAPSKERSRNLAKISKGFLPQTIWLRVETTAPTPGPQKLRKIVNRDCISVSELARLCDISQGTMARIIDGRSREVRSQNLEKINAALGLRLRAQHFTEQA